MAFTMLAVVLVITVPAMAEDIDVECEADGGHCEKQVSHEVWQEVTDEEDPGSEPQEDVFEAPVLDEVSDEECSEGSFPPCRYYWPWPH